MPAIAVYSSALNNAPNKVLVETSDTTEDASGIVRVGVSYVAKSSDAESVSRTMVLDSEPPEYPNTVFRNQLKRRRLYQYQRTIEQNYGIAKIRGYYAGVLDRSQVPQIQSDTETFNLNVTLTLEDVVRLSGDRDLTARLNRAFPETATQQGFFTYNTQRSAFGYVLFSFSGRSNIIRRSFGALVDQSSSQSLAQITLSEAIVSLRVQTLFGDAQLRAIINQSFGLLPDQDLALIREPIDWLASMTRGWNIDYNINTEYITPTVVVINSEARLWTGDYVLNLVSAPPPAVS